MQIQIININKFSGSSHKRVAAYARVSADKDEACHSLSQQISYYNDYIGKHPDWVFAGIYGDEGITGTKEERPGYQKMMEEARTGKFDLLITKSVTRLARNTVTLLKTVRELKGLGIDVYFEKENIHSISPNGEMMLTFLAMYAEEEARSASENKRWQIRRSFEHGNPIYISIYGYRWEEGRLVIKPEEAAVVRRIFELYLVGRGSQSIAKIIRDEQQGDGRRWSNNTIRKMLRNEKYKGDLILQKTHIPDYRTKKQYINKGQWRKYLIENTHEAIVPPEIFDRVQEEIKRREGWKKEKKETEKPLFQNMIICSNCKNHYVRSRNNSAKDRPYVWACRKYMKEGVKRCRCKRILESILIAKAKEVLKIPEETELTREMLESQMKYIEARPDNKLRFFLRNGRVETVEWQNPSRSRSWTKEMREKARQIALARLQAQRSMA